MNERTTLWLTWTGTTALGAGVGGALAAILLDSVDAGDGTFLLSLFVSLAVLGVTTGLAQAISFRVAAGTARRRALTSLLWAAAGGAGLAVLGTVATAVTLIVISVVQGITVGWSYETGLALLGSPVPILLLVAWGAVSTSALQQRILSKRFGIQGRWLWTSTAGWCVGTAVGLGLIYLTSVSHVAQGTAGGTLAGAIAGTITGRLLARLLSGVASHLG